MTFETILTRLSALRILVVGDAILDHYLWGDATRISPEAPVPVVDVARESFVLGGAANVAANLNGLGVQAHLVTSLGDDEAGRQLQQCLGERGIGLHAATSAAATIVKTRVVVQRQQLCRLDREGPAAAYAMDSMILDEAFTSGRWDAVIVSDYAKGVVTDALLAHLRSRAGRNTGNILLTGDPKPKRPLDWSGFDLLTPNRSESAQLAGMGEFDAETTASTIFSRYAPAALVITLGADGMQVCSREGETRHLATEARELFDVSGAGDTVIAVLTAALAADASLQTAAILGNLAAGVSISHLGTSPVTLDELRVAVGHLSH